MTDPVRLALHQLDDVALHRLLTNMLAYADWKLGARSGSGPETGAEDLVVWAITDTLEDERNWKATHISLESHLRGCINRLIYLMGDPSSARRVH